MDSSVKRCCTCGEQRPLSEFNKRAAAKDGLQSRCRFCSRDWYERNKAAHKANVAERNKRYRAWMWEQIGLYLARHPCVDCGESDPRCLEFDHRDPKDKTANVATLVQRSRAWSTIAAEIEKCDVRCANCHRRRTSGQFSTWRHRLHQEQTADVREVVEGRMSVLFPGWRSDGDVRVVDGADAARA